MYIIEKRYKEGENIKKYLFPTIFLTILICWNNIYINAQAENYFENIGVIVTDTSMYVAPDSEALCIGKIQKGSRVNIVSMFSEYALVNYDNQYGYLAQKDLIYDTDFETLLGKKQAYSGRNNVLITEGNLYERTVDLLMQAYRTIPENIRMTFEKNNFRIKMTEWDIVEEAYLPYGGYWGMGKVQAVLDYEKKLIYVNDEFPNSIVHEMGHFVNNYLQMYSSRRDNKLLFYREAGKISSYAEENDREFFAEAFRLYITSPQILQMLSPDTYAMVNNAINLFSG